MWRLLASLKRLYCHTLRVLLAAKSQDLLFEFVSLFDDLLVSSKKTSAGVTFSSDSRNL